MGNGRILVVGGPIEQMIDPVLKLVPTGNGRLATLIADEFEFNGFDVTRWGNFSGAETLMFEELQNRCRQKLNFDVIIFLAHLPNILISPLSDKIRSENDWASLGVEKAPKLVQLIKLHSPKAVLVPFKLIDQDVDRIEVIKWMLKLKVGWTVYLRLGLKGRFWLTDALGNETEVERSKLAALLAKTIERQMKVRRRSSKWQGVETPQVEYLEALVDFSRKMQPGFSQLIERNVASGRWPGNFSFRCTHSFLSKREKDGFMITRRNVAKNGMKEEDFVLVAGELKDDHLVFWGDRKSKPSTDAPVHRIIYQRLPWVKYIVHGHMFADRDRVVGDDWLDLWPCGAENEGEDVVRVAPKDKQSLWVVNVTGHGFVALIGDEDPRDALNELSKLKFTIDK